MEDMKGAPFSLVLDETTRLAATKSVSVCARYFSEQKSKIVTAFLGSMYVANADIDGVADAILALVSDLELDGSNLIALVSDGITEICPERGALLGLLRKDCPNVVHLHSAFNAITLAFHTAAKRHLPLELAYLLRETYNWFAQSVGRQTQYASFIEASGFHRVDSNLSMADAFSAVETTTFDIGGATSSRIIPKGLRPIAAETSAQWVDVASFFPQWMEQFGTMKAHFQKLADTGECFQAKKLASMYNNDQLRALAHAIKPFLRDLRRVQEVLEICAADKGMTERISLQLGGFLQQMGNRILQKEVVDSFSPDELCDVVLDSGSLLPIDRVAFDEDFKSALASSQSLSSAVKRQTKEQAHKFMQDLFSALQGILKDSLIVLRSVESFYIPNFFANQLERTSLIGPFFGQTEEVGFLL